MTNVHVYKCTPEFETQMEQVIVEGYLNGFLKEQELEFYVKHRLIGWDEQDVQLKVQDFFEFVRDYLTTP